MSEFNDRDAAGIHALAAAADGMHDERDAELRRLRQQVEAAGAKLARWERAESLPDCPACAALDAEGE